MRKREEGKKHLENGFRPTSLSEVRLACSLLLVYHLLQSFSYYCSEFLMMKIVDDAFEYNVHVMFSIFIPIMDMLSYMWSGWVVVRWERWWEWINASPVDTCCANKFNKIYVLRTWRCNILSPSFGVHSSPLPLSYIMDYILHYQLYRDDSYFSATC